VLIAVAAIDGVLALIREREANPIVAWIVLIHAGGLRYDRLTVSVVACKPNVEDGAAR
jgi:hypothetical protein